MKTLLILVACALGGLTFTPTADAAYRRTVMGYDSRGNPIIRVVWVADHLDFPRTVYDRRTYPTSGRRDPGTIYPPYSYSSYNFSPSYTAYTAYSSSD
jgi:hypothetical protein